ATFLRSSEQHAIIDGRLYAKGQHLLLKEDSGWTYSTLFVAAVEPMKVILQGGGKRYELAYPEKLGEKRPAENDNGRGRAPAMAEIEPAGQLAFYQRLLNSPLGALGKGLIGGSKQSAPPAGARGLKRAGPLSGSTQR